MNCTVQLLVKGTFNKVKNPRLRFRKGDTIEWDPATGVLQYQSRRDVSLRGPLEFVMRPIDHKQGDVRVTSSYRNEDVVRALVASLAIAKDFNLHEERSKDGRLVWMSTR